MRKLLGTLSAVKLAATVDTLAMRRIGTQRYEGQVLIGYTYRVRKL